MRKKRRAIVAFLFAMMMLLAACGDSAKTPDTPASEATADEGEKKDFSHYTINMGYYNCDHMIAGPVGEAAGIYEKYGLKVNLTGNGKVPEAMAAAQMDAGLVGFSTVVGAVGKGSPIIVTAMNHTGGSRYLVVSNDIEKGEELYGQPVAFKADKNLELMYDQTIGLSQDPAKYEFVNIGSDADKYLALTQGQIKAYTCCDPWASMAVYNKTGKILDRYVDVDNGICCAFTMSKKFMTDHEDVAIQLLKAYQESTMFCYEHPVKTAQIFAEYYAVPAEVGLMTMYEKCVNEGRTLSWKHEPSRIEHSYNLYKDNGILETMPPLEDVYAEEIYNKAELDDFDEFIATKIDPIFPRGMSYEDFKAKAEEIDGPLEP